MCKELSRRGLVVAPMKGVRQASWPIYHSAYWPDRGWLCIRELSTSGSPLVYVLGRNNVPEASVDGGALVRRREGPTHIAWLCSEAHLNPSLFYSFQSLAAIL